MGRTTPKQTVFGRIQKSYGHDKILRAYIGLPKPFPLNVQIQHGWYGTYILDFETADQSGAMLVWSKRIADAWKKETDKEVLISGAPFLMYREMHGLMQFPDASGTVAFPAHSTQSISLKYDVDEYCRQLNDLPEHMKPITVCLHYRDMPHSASQFEQHGFTVVTAGESRQPGDGFVRNFYRILSAHKYSTSNMVGSYSFYSIEMGIPFFICGPSSELIGDKVSEVVRTPGHTEYIAMVHELFSEFHETIPKQIKQFVLDELGYQDRVDATSLRRLFIKKFFTHELPRYPLRLARRLCGIS
jgi:hypothetical protein